MSSSCINLEPHNYVLAERTWQTVNYAQYQILNHSEEVAICTRCGEIVRPFAGAVQEKSA